METELDPNMSA